MSETWFKPFAEKMRTVGQSEAAIRSFRRNFESALDEPAVIRENEIQPLNAAEVTCFNDLEDRPFISSLLSQTLILKLNGGLGTTMGLDGPKALLKAKGNHTFLDLIIGQVHHLRRSYRDHVRLTFMNSFNTSREVTAYLRKHHPKIAAEEDLEFVQTRVPKIAHSKAGFSRNSCAPVAFAGNPDLEWCPPGHGDLYACLWDLGILDRLLKAGVRYLFVSNSDNLGATLDPRLLGHLSGSGRSLLMEVAERTQSDQKGGHLARHLKDGKLVLREAAQCREEDRPRFEDIQRHRYFNTNNLWLRLDRIRDRLDLDKGLLPLPVIKNRKNVDPADRSSPEALQLETACGSAIGLFEDAGAVLVPRSRFLPVKTHADLERLRSDEFEVTEDYSLTARR